MKKNPQSTLPLTPRLKNFHFVLLLILQLLIVHGSAVAAAKTKKSTKKTAVKKTSEIVLPTVAKPSSPTLSLDEFLNQVKGQSVGYLAAEQNAEAYAALKKKADLVTAINLVTSVEEGFAQQNQALQIFRYTTVYTRTKKVALTQTSNLGVETSVGYTLLNSAYKGLNTSTSANPSLAQNNYQATPVLQVALPLWRNLFGSSTRASKDYTQFTNEVQRLNAKATSMQSLVASEQSYWQLVATQKITKIQENALDSAQQILAYVTKREKMNLGDKGDVLQARALVESKNLLLKQAQNDEKIAVRNFNKNRFLSSDRVAEKLVDFDLKYLKNFTITQEKIGSRFDVKSSEASMHATVANAKIDEENAKPSLKLYGSYAENQVERSTAQALSSSFDRRGKSGTIGLQLSMPINIGLTSDIREGAIKSASAARMQYRQKIIEEQNDWGNLVQNLLAYQENLKLAEAIEAAQKAKLLNERNLLRQGRTTTYQVLLFEQDYSNAQLTVVQIANQLLSLIAQQKLYQN